MRPLRANKGPKETDESSDTFDTIDWLLKYVRGHNGKVGQWGISYPGFYAACGMIDAHPALKAVSPQAPVIDLFDGDDVRHNGAFLLVTQLWLHELLPQDAARRCTAGRRSSTSITARRTRTSSSSNLGPLKNADAKYLKGGEPFWNDIMTHDVYDDYCKARDVRPHIKNIKPAVMTVGGWFDAEDLSGTLAAFRRIEATGPPAAGNHLVMGPWQHGGWAHGSGDKLGDVSFRVKTSEIYREQIELPFFDFHLKGKGTNKHPKAWVFETGTNNWRKFSTWPPEGQSTSLVFADAGRLLMKKDSVGKPGFDEFVSDPARPVPFINKTTLGMSSEYMTGDQRFAATRPDVLVYQTPKLESDVTIAGPIEVELFVSTTGTDADWVVKLIDVYPGDFPNPDPNPTQVKMGSYQQLVRGHVMRGKFRNGLDKPEPFKPGAIATIKFTLPDVLHTFRPGHRIMVQVQSSWFPLIDRNPQTFCDIGTANEADFQKATHRVYRDGERASRLNATVLK